MNFFPLHRILLLWKKVLRSAIFLGTILIAPAALAVNEGLEIPNPVGSEDFFVLIERIARALVTAAVPFAVLALVYGAFKFISGSVSGNPKEISEAKMLFVWTLIGTAILVGAWAIATAAVNFAKDL
jgi:hypothetical protein